MVGAFIMEIFMGKMVACVLIVIVGLLALAVTGFIQIVRAWLGWIFYRALGRN